MKALVLQHLAVEHPGVLRDFLARDGVTLTTVELDEGEVIPALEPFDMMLVMGGPQDVWEEASYPWLRHEKEAIRRFVQELRRPYLGICLGHQLLADAIGGTVGLADQGEVGVMTIAKTEAGHADPVAGVLADPLTVLQWHGAEVTALPDGAVVLASSPACKVQAFRYGEIAYGMQFHMEITSSTVADWAAIPTYAASLEKHLGAGAVAALAEKVNGRMGDFNRDAEGFYRAFMEHVTAKRGVLCPT